MDGASSKKALKKVRLNVIEKACQQVSRGVFFSTIIIIVSFLPIFLLTEQEGKLFHPLAYTKTFIIVIDAILVLVLAPVLISFFVKGSSDNAKRKRKKRWIDYLEDVYAAVIRLSMRFRKTVLFLNILVLGLSVPLLLRMGREFMPPLDEGSLLFMPVSLPNVSNSEIKRILQVQDRIIASEPEVAHVLGKAGRANTATDNAPLSMVETIILLKPKHQWRKGVTKESIIASLDEKLRIPGIINAWTMPIINRINMLSTGIRTDVGIKVYGQDVDSIMKFAEKIRNALHGVVGVEDLYIEQITGGSYLDFKAKRSTIARYKMSVEDINSLIEKALGSITLTTVIKGRERIPITARYAQDFRRSLSDLERLPVRTPYNGFVPLGVLADMKIQYGPAMINSDNALLRGVVFFNVRNRDLVTTISDARKILDTTLQKMPKGYHIMWSGQYEHLLRSESRLKIIIPIVLVIIFLSMYAAFKSWREAFFSLISLPFALVGGILMTSYWGVHFSVAVGVGFIALLGLAVETGIVMVMYLNDAMGVLYSEKIQKGISLTRRDLEEAVISGAAKRLRPKLMTVMVTLLGLVPILWSTETGSDMMKPIVLPMIGGVFTSAVHILLVTPIIFLMTKEYEYKKTGTIALLETSH